MNKYWPVIPLIFLLLASFACRRSSTASPSLRTITVSLQAPDPAWTISISEVRDAGAYLIIISHLSHRAGAAAQMITKIRDQVDAALPSKPVKVYVVGKTWNWDGGEPYEFVAGDYALSAIRDQSTLLFSKPRPPLTDPSRN